MAACTCARACRGPTPPIGAENLSSAPIRLRSPPMWGKGSETGGSSRLWLTTALALIALLVALVLSADHSAAHPSGLQHAIDVQEQSSAGLLDRGAVVGTAVSAGA